MELALFRAVHAQNRADAALLTVRQNAGQAPVFLNDAGECGAEMHLAAQPDDVLAHRADDVLEDVRPDVRFCLGQDVRRRAVRHQRVQYDLAERIVDARHQLAVGIGSRAALAELDVAPLGERAAAPELLDRPVAVFHTVAALEHDRTVAVFREQMRREQSRRTESDDHRSVG